MKLPHILIAAAFIFAAVTIPRAQATRTWVSGVGDDVNPCSRTAPCKTFAGAISKTAAGGEISVLDPGGFGAVTITKSITINGDGTLASILSAGTTGVVINAAATDTRVVLRNLSINGAGTGTTGINFIAGGSLTVENCTIANATGVGIDFHPASAANLFVRDSAVRFCGGGGIFVRLGSGFVANAAVERVSLQNNLFGIRVDTTAVRPHNTRPPLETPQMVSSLTAQARRPNLALTTALVPTTAKRE